MIARDEISKKFRQRFEDANRTLRSIKARDLRTAMTGRNAAFALGAALVVVLIWIFNTGGNDTNTAALRQSGASSPAAIMEEMSKTAVPDVSATPEAPAEKAAQPDPVNAEKSALEASVEKTEQEKEERRRAALADRTVQNPNFDESVEVDISTRSVAVTSGFSGQRIVVFGAVHNSLQASPQQGLYDVIVILEGMKTKLVSRRKSNVAGLWINTQSIQFESVPSYYTISSTRPIVEISTPQVFDEHGIGFRHIRIEPRAADASKLPRADLQTFRESIIRLKAKEGLYQRRPTGVEFIGRSLFRTSIDLPANVPIGTVVARTYLFRDAELIAENTAAVELQRQGLEALMYSFAFDYPLFYGMFAVAIAVGAGLAASAVFSRGAH